MTVGVTAMAVPRLSVANVPVPTKATLSPRTTPERVPVIIAAVVPSYDLLWAAAPESVSCLGAMSAVRPVGCVSL